MTRMDKEVSLHCAVKRVSSMDTWGSGKPAEDVARDSPQSVARELGYLFIYLKKFFPQVILPSEVPRLATDPPKRVFPGVWKFLSF